MPIPVVCPGCRKRFSVSDKNAGKKGPCPQCKTIIQVPAKGEEVVVHAPEQFGPKDKSGRAVLKPIERTETRFSWKLAVLVAVASIAILVVALLLRSPKGNVSTLILMLGAMGLAPPLVWSGYAFLRDDELEPYSGRELSIRVAICAAAYVIVWGAVAIVTNYALAGVKLEVLHMVCIVPAMVGVGSFAAWASLDLEFGTAAIHYGLYLLVTVLLRLIMNLYPI